MPSKSGILASKSPRRKNILRQIGLDFEIDSDWYSDARREGFLSNYIFF